MKSEQDKETMFKNNVTNLMETKSAQQQKITLVQKQLTESKVKIEEMTKTVAKDE